MHPLALCAEKTSCREGKTNKSGVNVGKEDTKVSSPNPLDYPHPGVNPDRDLLNNRLREHNLFSLGIPHSVNHLLKVDGLNVDGEQFMRNLAHPFSFSLRLSVQGL
jgi:hypothetical protein